MPTALFGFSGNHFYEHRMWEKKSGAVFQPVGNKHSFHRQAKEVFFSLKTHPLRKWIVCWCLFKMLVQAESLKISLVAGLVTVLAGVFWSFLAYLLFVGFLIICWQIYLRRLFIFCTPFCGRVGRRMKQKHLIFSKPKSFMHFKNVTSYSVSYFAGNHSLFKVLLVF